ncbi:MAG: hypothetical protein PWP27_698 [Clostridiales bacterium]|jgi:hypothetical protein|nr:hypothetical protein [Clostridiales bacterium]MDK2932888.1 hypothetical protein [Clostridiales bacterium]
MDEIKKSKLKFILCLLTGMVIGVLIGITGLNALVSYRIDQYHKKIRSLETVIEDNNVRLKKFEESMKNRNKFILKDIEIFLLYDGDDMEKISLEKHIKEKYNMLLGKEVKNIDIEMVAEVIDKRIMRIDENEYKLKVTRLMLSDVLKIWVEVNVKVMSSE